MEIRQQICDFIVPIVQKNRKRLLFCIDTLGGGGAERLLIDILKRLDYRLFDVTLYVLLSNRGVYFADVPEQVNLYTPFFVDPKHFSIDNQQYDVEIAFLEGYAVKYVASRRSRAVKIGWVHTNLFRRNWPRQFYDSLQEEWDCFDAMDKLVFVSADSLNGFVELFSDMGNEKQVIHNLLSEEDIVGMSQEKAIPETKFTICSVGSLCKDKGHDRSLNVMARLLSEGYDFQFWILGEGEERKNLERQIAELNLTGKVELKGFVKNPYPYVAQADLYLSSSNVEGFSLALGEALCLGVPVLATRSGGAEEVLKGGEFGMLVPIDEEAIYRGIKSLLDNPSLYAELQQKAQKGKEQFDVKRTMEIITDLLQNA